MRIIRIADCRRMPWKNGGGETVEIAISPEGAGIDDFDWRLSMARVETDGPFSLFAGVDRTLAVLEGEGIFLKVEGHDPFELTRITAPLSFPADVPTSAALIAGPITDLNMMTRRAKAAHSVTRMTVDAACELSSKAQELLLFCQSGTVRVGGDAALLLERHDTLHAHDIPEILQLRADGSADLFLIEIMAAA